MADDTGGGGSPDLAEELIDFQSGALRSPTAGPSGGTVRGLTSPIELTGSIFFSPMSREALLAAREAIDAGRSVGTSTHRVAAASAGTQTSSSSSSAGAPAEARPEATAHERALSTAFQAARERELQSIIRSSEASFANELQSRLRRAEGEFAQRASVADAEIDRLHRIVAQREEVVASLREQLRSADAATEERLREQRRGFKVFEGSLHAEMSRMLRDKERSRFEAEVATNNLANARALIGSAETRAHEAECRWHEQRRAELQAAAHDEKQRLYDAAAAHTAALGTALAANREMLAEVQARAAAESCALRRGVVNALGRSDADADGCATAPSDADVIAAVRDVVDARAAEAEQGAQTAAATEASTEALRCAAEDLRAHLDAVDSAARTKISRLGDRVAALERQLASVAKRAGRDMSRRASAKAAADVMEELVATHEAELEALRGANREQHVEIQRLRVVSMVEEAAEWKGRYAAAAAEAAQLRSERRLLAVKAETLATDLRITESSATESSAALRAKIDEVETLKSTLDTSAAAWAAERSRWGAREEQLAAQLGSLEEAARRDELQLSAARAEIASLRAAVTSLQDANVAMEVERTADRLRRVEAASSDDAAAAAAPAAQRAAAPAMTRGNNSDDDDALASMKRQRDTLKRRLDSAIAEIAALEERRSNVTSRHLQLLSSADALPRREAELRRQLHEVERGKEQQQRRGAELDARAADLDARELQLQRRIAQLKARGGASTGSGVLSARWGLPPGSSRSTVASQDAQSPPTSSIAAPSPLVSTGGFTPGSATTTRLAPLAHRPPASLPPPSAPHPQRPERRLDAPRE